jgi:adenylylsulfate kinase-like enzyme
LALTGLWGSGKISIKNLLTEELRSTPNSPRVPDIKALCYNLPGAGGSSLCDFQNYLA